MTLPRTLHLIPVGLGDSPLEQWLPAETQALAARLTTYIAENAKTARAFLKLVGATTPLQEITIHTLTAKTEAREIRQWLSDNKVSEIGLISEAGCPAVADPGATVAAQAHDMGMRVVPWVGPSSILLALMASGLDGQRFAFHGYAPVDAAERARQLKHWEIDSAKHNQTQIFIETPYRNDAMYATLVQTLKGNTRLCIARALTTTQELVQTHPVTKWKDLPTPTLHKQPTIFLFLASR